MKNIVEPRGSFMLVDPYTGDQVAHNRPSVVRHSSFIESRVANGQLRLHGNVNLDATDVELVKYLAESKEDTELAIAAFMSAFPLEKKEEEKEKKPTRAPKKSVEE